MKKFIVLIAAAGALAIVPSSALAVSNWGGWGGTGASPTSHTDNVASPAYWQAFPSPNGQGDSQYCADTNPNAGTHCTSPDAVSSPTSCATACALYSPVYFAGYLNDQNGGCATGCGHGGTRSPCQTTGPGGGIYLGTDPDPTKGTNVGVCQ
jgi:hypothetical protein